MQKFDSITDVKMREFEVIQPGPGESFIGTMGIFTCIGLKGYERSTGAVLIAHFVYPWSPIDLPVMLNRLPSKAVRGKGMEFELIGGLHPLFAVLFSGLLGMSVYLGMHEAWTAVFGLLALVATAYSAWSSCTRFVILRMLHTTLPVRVLAVRSGWSNWYRGKKISIAIDTRAGVELSKQEFLRRLEEARSHPEREFQRALLEVAPTWNGKKLCSMRLAKTIYIPASSDKLRH